MRGSERIGRQRAHGEVAAVNNRRVRNAGAWDQTIAELILSRSQIFQGSPNLLSHSFGINTPSPAPG